MKKQTFIKLIICIVIFSMLYMSRGYETSMTKWVNNKVSYALNHNTDFHSVFYSTVANAKTFITMVVDDENKR